jgi:hypothetical protein
VVPTCRAAPYIAPRAATCILHRYASIYATVQREVKQLRVILESAEVRLCVRASVRPCVRAGQYVRCGTVSNPERATNEVYGGCGFVCLLAP